MPGSLTLSAQKIVCNNVHGRSVSNCARETNAAFAEIAVQLGSDILGDFWRIRAFAGIGFQGLKTSSGNFDLTERTPATWRGRASGSTRILSTRAR